MFNKNNNSQPQPTERQKALSGFNSARGNILLIIILTVVNALFLVFEVDRMMLFSATIPYYSLAFALLFEATPLIIGAAVITLVVLALFVLCYVKSAKDYIWMTVALALFALDTVALIGLSIWLGDISGILDLIIHAYILISFIMGVVNGKKLRNMPEEVATPVGAPAAAVLNGEPTDPQNK